MRFLRLCSSGTADRRVYVLLYGWIRGRDAQQTFEAGEIAEPEFHALTPRVMEDLRRRGFSVPRLRRLLAVLRTRFKVRLYEAIEGGGPLTLFIDGDKIYARTASGDLFNVLEQPRQPLLMLGENIRLRELTVRESPARKRKRTPTA